MRVKLLAILLLATTVCNIASGQEKNIEKLLEGRKLNQWQSIIDKSIEKTLNDKQMMGGKEIGNGGDGLICHDQAGNIQSVELFDYWQASQNTELPDYDLGPKNLPFEKKIELVLNRIERVNPTRAKLYRRWFKEFFKPENFKWAGNLMDIPDTGAATWPGNCEIVQLAVQQKPELPGEKRYMIRKDLWDNHLDNDHKAGLILHELIYREAKADRVCYKADACYYPHLDSRKVRFYNAVVSSKDFESYTLKQYLELIQLVQFSKADAHGIPFNFRNFDHVNGYDWREVTFYDDNHVKQVRNADRSVFQRKFSEKYLIGNSSFNMEIEPNKELNFYPNGKVKELKGFRPKGYVTKFLFIDEDLRVERTGWGSVYPNRRPDKTPTMFIFNELGALSSIKEEYEGNYYKYNYRDQEVIFAHLGADLTLNNDGQLVNDLENHKELSQRGRYSNDVNFIENFVHQGREYKFFAPIFDRETGEILRACMVVPHLQEKNPTGFRYDNTDSLTCGTFPEIIAVFNGNKVVSEQVFTGTHIIWSKRKILSAQINRATPIALRRARKTCMDYKARYSKVSHLHQCLPVAEVTGDPTCIYKEYPGIRVDVTCRYRMIAK